MANILIVGDDREIAQTHQDVLHQANCQVVGVCPSMPQAIALFDYTLIDLLIIDISALAAGESGSLPEGQIGWSQLNLPVIVIVDPLDEPLVEWAIAAQPASLLLKPVRPMELRAALKLALMAVQRERQRQQIETQVVDRLYEQMQHLKASLEEQIQHRTRQLRQAFHFEAILKRITDRVRDSLDEKHILQTAVRELALAIGVTTCNAALYDLEHQTSTLCHEFSTVKAQPFQSYSLDMEQFAEGYAQLLLGEYFQFCDWSPQLTAVRTAKLSCPIVDDQGVLGDLWLIHHAEYGFTEQDIRLVEMVANQCAIALRQTRLFQATQVQVQELERLNRLKDDFLSTISHELRTPMANIKMAITMLDVMRQSASGSVSDVANRYFTILQTECQREIELIDNLLDLSELAANPLPFAPTVINLDECIQQAIALYGDRAKHAHLTLSCEVRYSVPVLLTDAHCLNRILKELLDNACKYTPSGETITVRVDVSEPTTAQSEWQLHHRGSQAVTVPSPTYIELRVINTGVEIPPQERSRIFDKFYRIPQGDPWKYSGTGLGLAIVKKLAHHIHGSITVHSAAQQTIFTLTLPYEMTG